MYGQNKQIFRHSLFWFFWFMRVLDLDRPRTKRVKYDCTLSAGVEISGLEGHWGVNYSVEGCGHCVKVCLVVLLLKRELDSLPECLRWWCSGWPPLLVTMWVIPDFRIWVIFLQGETFLVEQKFARLSASNFANVPRQPYFLSRKIKNVIFSIFFHSAK